MVEPLSRNPLDMGFQKALMTPKVGSSDSVLQFTMADIMQIDSGELDNQPKAYHESISDFKSCCAIVAGCALDPWFLNLHNP